MDTLPVALILKAMDGLATRATVTAQNIANANSPGYRPLKVTFEEALKRAASADVEAVSSVEPEIALAVDREGGTELRLDLELATATATSGRYGALAQLLSRQLELQSIALSGNR